MSASYPSSSKSFTPLVDNTDYPQAAQVNQIYDELTALEQALLSTGLAHHLKFVDATYDIGQSGATRPRHLYLSGNATVGGGQIAFPAAQNASSDGNTLDDYEEGSFTPTVGSSGGGTPTYSAQAARYVKVGKRVDFWLDVALATKGTLAAGNIRVDGLPFTAAGSLIQSAAIGFFSGMSTSIVHLIAHNPASTTRLDVWHMTAAGTGLSQTQVSDVGATWRIVIAGTYEASA